MKLKDNVIAQYSLGTFAVTSVFAVVLGYFLTTWTFDFQISHHIDLYPDFISQMVEESKATELFLKNPDSFNVEELEEAKHFFNNLKELGKIFRVKVWSEGGLIIWSDRYDIIGKSFPDNKHFKKAWLGEIAYNVVKPHKEEHQTEKGRSTVLEVYTPIIIDGRVIAVIELYEGADEVFNAIRQNTSYIYILIGVTVSILYGMLFFVFYRAHNRQKEINIELSRTQESKRNQEELNKLLTEYNQELANAFDEVKDKNRILKICKICQEARDNRGRWITTTKELSNSKD